MAIVAIVTLAYIYFRLFTGPGTLTQIGLLSFAAVAQFAPSLVGGVLWRGDAIKASLPDSLLDSPRGHTRFSCRRFCALAIRG